MPRNSAFKKATKAITKTRDFFNYESPYRTVVPLDTEASHGPYGAGPGDAAASSTTPSAATAAYGGRSLGDKPGAMVPKKPARPPLLDQISVVEDADLLDQKDSEESESSNDEKVEDDDSTHVTAASERDVKDGCQCKICLAARITGVAHQCNPKDSAAVVAVKKATKGRYRTAATEALVWAKNKQSAQIQSHHDGGAVHLAADIGGSREELQEQSLAETDLRDVLRWACQKITKVTMPLGPRALQQLVQTLIASAKAGSMARLIDDMAQVTAVQRATVRNSELTEWPLIGKHASQQIAELRTAVAQASSVEKSISEVLNVLRQQVQGAVEKYSEMGEAGPQLEDKKMNVTSKVAMTDPEYNELSARILIVNGLPPNFSENDVVKLLSRYGEVAKCKAILPPRGQGTGWFYFLTMASSEAAQEAQRGLHGRVIAGHAVGVEKPSAARLVRAIQAQNTKNRVAKSRPWLQKGKQPTSAQPAPRMSYVDKEYLADRLQQLSSKEKDEVAQIISTDVLAVKGGSTYRVVVDVDELSDLVLLQLLTYFCKRFGCVGGDPQAKVVHLPASSQAKSGMPAVHPEIRDSSKQQHICKAVIADSGSKKRRHAVTKWDLLRGLKCATEDFLQMGVAMSDARHGRFNHPSVLNAPNLPTGAYTILRNDMLAENIGKLLHSIRDRQAEWQRGRTSRQQAATCHTDGKAAPTQPENAYTAAPDPVARRWKSLRRDFPDVATIISKLQPERDQIRAWAASGRQISSSCLWIGADDDRPDDAVAQALANNDLQGTDDLAGFAQRVVEMDRDARLKLEKAEPGEINLRRARRKELLELAIKLTARYPGLDRSIGLDTELPYSPDNEEQFGQEC